MLYCFNYDKISLSCRVNQRNFDVVSWIICLRITLWPQVRILAGLLLYFSFTPGKKCPFCSVKSKKEKQINIKIQAEDNLALQPGVNLLQTVNRLYQKTCIVWSSIIQ